jgi:hypothetical protein
MRSTQLTQTNSYPAYLPAEMVCLITGLILLSIAALGLIFGINMPQHAHYHDFADQRALWGLPFAGDVLSNLAFAAIGVYGLFTLSKADRPTFSSMQWGLMQLSFYGLILTAAASGFYHWAPDNYGLTIDRLGMTCAFAGMIGLALATRISDRAGFTGAIVIFVFAPFAIVHWQQTGNLWLWSVLQGGGLLALLALAFRRPTQNSVSIQLGWLVGWYVIAKLLELNDQPIFDWTGQVVSGHTLKHLAAALATWPLVKAVCQSRS